MTTGPGRDAALRLVIDRIRLLDSDVREFTLRAGDRGRLPSFPPGSHLAVRWGPGEQNSYSLTGPEVEPDHYTIAVRLDPAGRGGSRWLHSRRTGDPLDVSRPRSGFAPVAAARHHLFVAGGIGVTAILSHMRAAVRWGRSFEVLYAHRGTRAPYAAELVALAPGSLTRCGSRAQLWERLHPALRDSPLGTHLYVCGPGPMIDAVAAAARAAGWPPQRVHSELFAPAPQPAGTPFTARLRRTGAAIPVAATTTLLDALRAHGTPVPNLCRRGVCGECRITVLDGAIEHRDTYLAPDERAAGDSMMACVSRAASPQLEIDL
ncbi:PDR/VanB family oxidoreductase [Nocardia sp. CA-290969]|uniref:PDR/VanB family oxidoreductase n=1 Tax=Nocardia sp. CA-290969 TaxID=3239986 RepID=UPI003D8C6139